MAEVTITFQVDQADVLRELTRLQHPPYLDLESVLLRTFVITQARVHVITGALKASGHTSSAIIGDDVWEGTIGYARYPGIYELARGPKPSKHHFPPDTHFFFDPVEAPIEGPWLSLEGEGAHWYESAIMDWLEE